MGNGNVHSHVALPLVAGRAAAPIKGGRHIRAREHDADRQPAAERRRTSSASRWTSVGVQQRDGSSCEAEFTVRRAQHAAGTAFALVRGLLALAVASRAADAPTARACVRRRQAGDAAAVRALMQQRADVNAPEADGTTALHWAVRADDAEMVGAAAARRRQGERGEPLRRDAAVAGRVQRQRGRSSSAAEGRRRRRTPPARKARRR